MEYDGLVWCYIIKKLISWPRILFELNALIEQSLILILNIIQHNRRKFWQISSIHQNVLIQFILHRVHAIKYKHSPIYFPPNSTSSKICPTINLYRMVIVEIKAMLLLFDSANYVRHTPKLGVHKGMK